MGVAARLHLLGSRLVSLAHETPCFASPVKMAPSLVPQIDRTAQLHRPSVAPTRKTSGLLFHVQNAKDLPEGDRRTRIRSIGHHPQERRQAGKSLPDQIKSLQLSEQVRVRGPLLDPPLERRDTFRPDRRLFGGTHDRLLQAAGCSSVRIDGDLRARHCSFPVTVSIVRSRDSFVKGLAMKLFMPARCPLSMSSRVAVPVMRMKPMRCVLFV